MRKKKTISLPEECLKWLDDQVKSRRFYNVSHGIEVAIRELMKKKEPLE